ncbi:sensor histidine kinase [Piscinibacter sp.]|uniref:sensor histidine kinase n=1 Tax=Piscinibacter sp. TaxID=1903157 RepID=UPI002BF4BFAC|nr:HAMP domain-containing sensor histidine kinase [Albitalea sp.]HUG21511.1 HAMP domain-containing sensor histidine kinase [Albitalea sp.]
MLVFAAFALVVATLFGAYAILLVYSVEDEFFENALRLEAAAQIEHHARTGRWTAPRSTYIALHEDPSSLPSDLRERYRAEPARSEHAGDAGRHYHLLRIGAQSATDSQAFLVAEVSRHLVVRRIRGDVLQWLAWGALGVVALALLAGYALAHRTAAPLAALARRVEAMQPDDPPQALAREFSTREVEVLARGLESLAARVHAFVVREREFTRDASHELRTPLAVIHSTCERLGHDASLSAAARRQIDFLRQSAWQLQQTVSTLLSLAREENAASLAEAVAVLPLLEQVVVEQAILLEGKPVDVTVDVPPQARVTLPPAVLRIVLGNLVGNAFAHTAAGRVRIDTGGGRLRIANTDGMDATVRNDPYQPFVKGEASSGHGLGLAIVRRLCESHALDLRITTGPQGTTTSLALDSGDGAAV